MHVQNACTVIIHLKSMSPGQIGKTGPDDLDYLQLKTMDERPFLLFSIILIKDFPGRAL